MPAKNSYTYRETGPYRKVEGATLHYSLLETFMEGLCSDPKFLTDKEQSGPKIYPEYQDDPVKFAWDKLRVKFPRDIERVLESIVHNKTTIVQSCNGPGKTFAAAFAAYWWLLTRRGAQTFTAAAPPEDNLKLLLWGEIGAMVENHASLLKGYKISLPSMRIERSKREFITGVTIPATGTEKEREARFSGKHAPFLLFIIDEGDAVPDEVYNGIEACMSGGVARLLVNFNPRRKMGPVYDMQTDGKGVTIRLSAFTHPNVVTGNDLFPGAVSREISLQRMNLWSRPLVDGEVRDKDCYEVPDYLVGQIGYHDSGEPFPPMPAGIRKITDHRFHYMVLGQYPTVSEFQLIDETWIDRANDNWDKYIQKYKGRPAYENPILGLDIGEYGPDPSVVFARWPQTHYTEIVKTWQGVDPFKSGERAARCYQDLAAKRINIDAIGVGSGVSRHMRKLQCPFSFGVKVSEAATKRPGDWEEDDIDNKSQFDRFRDQLWWEAKEWLRTNSNACLPRDKELKEELLAATYEEDNRTGRIKICDKKKFKERIKRSPNKADAFCLTFASEDDEGSDLISFNYAY